MGWKTVYYEWDNEYIEKYIPILEDFPIPSLEDQFGDGDDNGLTDENNSCHESRRKKNFLFENNVPQMESDISPLKNVWYILKKMELKLQPKLTEKLKYDVKLVAAIYPNKWVYPC